MFLFTRIQAFWGSVLTTACPVHQIQKVSSWSLCQVWFQLLFPSLPKNSFFLAKFGSQHVMLLIQKKPPAFQEKANHLEGATPLRKQRREHILLCIQFTLRHITSQVPPVFCSSQNSARPPTHFLAKWLTQKSSREAAATAGRKKQAQLAKQHRVGRSHSLGTKRVGYGLPWNEQCNGGRITEVMRRKDREERAYQGKELSTSTAVNSPKFLPSSWFPSFQK